MELSLRPAQSQRPGVQRLGVHLPLCLGDSVLVGVGCGQHPGRAQAHPTARFPGTPGGQDGVAGTMAPGWLTWRGQPAGRMGAVAAERGEAEGRLASPRLLLHPGLSKSVWATECASLALGGRNPTQRGLLSRTGPFCEEKPLSPSGAARQAVHAPVPTAAPPEGAAFRPVRSD